MGISSRAFKAVASWYRGRYVSPPENDPDSTIVIVSAGHYEQPLIASVIAVLAGFYIRHWQWVWSTILALLGLYLAVLALK